MLAETYGLEPDAGAQERRRDQATIASLRTELVNRRELEARFCQPQAQLDERDREVLALRDSLRKTIPERNTGA